MYSITKMDAQFSKYSIFSESAAKPAHSFMLKEYRKEEKEEQKRRYVSA